jgi:hypothetical protein
MGVTLSLILGTGVARFALMALLFASRFDGDLDSGGG